MSTKSSLSINVDDALSFFDEKPTWADGHSTAVVAMIFEDLAAATLEHCLIKNGAQHVATRPEPVVTGKRKGPWLDRWIEADMHDGEKFIFQTEIKSLSAHSNGHQPIPVNADEAVFQERAQANWDLEWDWETNTLIHQRVAKVLIPMKRPDGTRDRQLRPLLICWKPMIPKDPSQKHNQVKGGHLFKMSNVTYQFGFRKPHSWKISPKFTELWVFSISSYLRSIRSETCRPLKLQMPNASEKMRALLRLVQVPSET